jgi:hypothetical protein
MRLFLMPGVGHCRGGVGPDQADFLGAMERWREAGQARQGKRPRISRFECADRGEQAAQGPARPIPTIRPDNDTRRQDKVGELETLPSQGALLSRGVKILLITVFYNWFVLVSRAREKTYTSHEHES